MTRIRICPRCKKPKLRSATNVSGWLAPGIYECLECGYIGHVYFEIDTEDLNDFKLNEEIEDKEKE